MNQAEGMVFALVVGSVVMTAWGDEITQAVMGGAGHARAQAAAEVRRARQIVIEHTKAKVREKTSAGRDAGPKSPWWWVSATARSAGAVRRGLRGLRAGARGGRTLPADSPWRRIFDAATAGAAAGFGRAREAKRARRAERPGFRERARDAGRSWTAWRAGRREETGAVPLGVCDECGVTAARTALEEVTRPDGVWLVCALCRAVPSPGATTTSGERPGGGAGAGEGTPPSGVEAPGPAVPAAAPHNRNGELMAGTGQVARRVAAPVAAAGAHVARTGGDVVTHGDYQRASEVIAAALETVNECKEGMLASLRAVDAGAGQVTAILGWADMERATAGFIRDALAEADARILPLIDVINGVGGTAEVAAPAYYTDF